MHQTGSLGKKSLPVQVRHKAFPSQKMFISHVLKSLWGVTDFYHIALWICNEMCGIIWFIFWVPFFGITFHIAVDTGIFPRPAQRLSRSDRAAALPGTKLPHCTPPHGSGKSGQGHACCLRQSHSSTNQSLRPLAALNLASWMSGVLAISPAFSYTTWRVTRDPFVRASFTKMQ